MKNITPLELMVWMDSDKEFALIDVREYEEHEAYNIGGILIPFDEIVGRMEELPQDRDIVLYCEKGIRSTIAIQKLEIKGRSGIYNLTGGMTRWRREVDNG